MVSKQDLIAQMEKGAASLAELPLSSALLRALAADLRAGEPRWWRQAQKAWENRTFATWSEAWGLLLSCLHYEVIADEKSALAPLFPSCGGEFKGTLGSPLNEVLAGLGDEFVSRLAVSRRRYFSLGLARLWHIPALSYFQCRELPYYLVEFGAGAGLNLASDTLFPKNKIERGLIEARIGLDAPTLSLDKLEHLRWLAACILPDQAAVLATLDQAINGVKDLLKRDPGYYQLVDCPEALQPAYIAKNIPSDETDVGLLVYNIGFTGRMSNADYGAFLQEMVKLMTPWGDRALWIEVESPRDKEAGTVLQYRLTRVDKGILRSFEMGRADFTAKVDVLHRKGTFEFLGLPPMGTGRTIWYKRR